MAAANRCRKPRSVSTKPVLVEVPPLHEYPSEHLRLSATRPDLCEADDQPAVVDPTCLRVASALSARTAAEVDKLTVLFALEKHDLLPG